MTDSNLTLPKCTICGKEFDTHGDTCQACLTANFDAESGEVKQIQQDTAEIYRKDNLALLNTQSLSGSEAVIRDTEHANFVYNSVLRDAAGVLYPDWNIRGQNHIQNLRRMMEQYRIDEGATRRVLAEERNKQMAKLSPEEREQWKKAIAKETAGQKPAKEPKPKPVPGLSQIEKMIQKALEMGFTEDSDYIKTLRKAKK